MDYRDALPELRQICIEELGERFGAQLAEHARPGFGLEPARKGRPATGRNYLGGPALLDPGTPWPDYLGIPLSPVAVLDTDPLASWLGEHLPVRPGLLNFFVFEPDLPPKEYPRDVDYDDPRWLRVIPADPARAAEVPAPAPARSFDRIPLHAKPVLTLPGHGDSAYRDFDWDTEIAAWPLIDQAEKHDHLAFGRPQWEQGPEPSWRDDHRHLLMVSPGKLGLDWSYFYFSVPAAAFRAGDFSQVVVGRVIH
ncbi:hypothetical protein GCM10022225_84890 [Plantactinospora mayteni]|uniref:DUF1963 domain-containing protein n=1 Tax=Plantactinospora mayteni TaxID=566021 RepID=A0ABQ4F4V1_9ACTN|nr:DUF1963 domain-containing protein [Plantactinospora mayteni]GIH01907.1 hypothetical protein Pma05_84790 [Plantactinospora mayteni]